MKICKLLLFFFFAIVFFNAESQTIQGSLRSGSDFRKQRLVIRNNSSAKITGNLTKVKFCLGTNFGDYFGSGETAFDFLSLNTMPVPGNGNFVTKSFASMSANYVNALWTGSIAIDLDPAEEMDIFEFSVFVKTDFKLWGQPLAPLSVSFRDPINTHSGEDWNWFVEMDGVDMTTSGWYKFYSTGPDVAVSTLVGMDAKATLTTFSFVNLPVRLSHFEGEREGNTAQLSWSTSEEVNSEYFGIEHSLDAKTWKEVGRVGSFGESRQERNYTFSHTPPGQAEINYYRLKMVDLDKTHTFSQIVNVKFKEHTTESVYPNPVVNNFQLTNGGLSNVSKVRVFDVSGKLVYESSRVDKTGVSLGHLTSGMFYIELENRDGNLKRHHILKK